MKMGCLVNSILTSYSSGGVFLMSGLEFSVLVKRGEKRFVKGFLTCQLVSSSWLREEEDQEC